MKLSIIIPVFNEEKTISKILTKVIALKFQGVKKEIIVVDDGSTDKTWSKIKEQRSKNKELKLLQHKENLGKGAAVRTGIKNATGDYIIIQDADLEYDPGQIKYLLEPVLQKKAKVVYGTRLDRLPHLSGEENNPRFVLHFFGNRFLSLVTSILYGAWITDMETCYKLFPAKFAKKIKLKSRSFDFEPEITAKILKAGYKIKELPIVAKPRSYDEGKKLRTFHDGSIALYTLIKYRIYD
jgi:dolichol-phosphate mannosyltransferase